MTGVKHLSHSSKSTWQMCGKAFELSRVQKVPGLPAWWNIGGSAVHSVTEKYDRMKLMGQERAFHLGSVWEAYFRKEIAEAEAVEPNRSLWRQTRRKNPPEGEAGWNQLGPQLAQAWIDWRRRVDWEIWTTPDGQPAIELDISGKLPGCEMEVKAYLDRIFYDPALNHLWVLDLKNGSKDADIAQLGTYRALVEVKYGAVASSGVTFNARKGGLSGPQSLSTWTPQYAGLQFGRMATAVKGGVFIPNIDSHCTFFCDVSHACYAVGGAQAERWDPDHPNHAPKF